MLSAGDFNQLRAFVTVAESLNFTRAAGVFGVSTSALSQLVRALEERLAMRLLNRTTRSVALTAAGRELYDRVVPAITLLDAAFARASTRTDEPAGVVRVHCFRRGADLFVAPMIRKFTDAYPSVVLDVTLDDEAVDVVSAGFDAAIRVGEVIERDMVAIRLGPDMRQIVVASPEYLSRHGAPATPRDVRNHACIRWRWDGHATAEPWEFTEDGRSFRVVVDGPLIVNSREIEQQAAVDGVGLAMLVEDRITPLLAQGKLVALLEQWSTSFAGYYLCFPEQRLMSPALEAFVTYLNSKNSI